MPQSDPTLARRLSTLVYSLSDAGGALKTLEDALSTSPDTAARHHCAALRLVSASVKEAKTELAVLADELAA